MFGANGEVAPQTALIYSLDYNIEFYVTKHVLESRVREAENQQIGVEIKRGFFDLRGGEEVELEPRVILRLKDLNPIYDSPSYDLMAIFEIYAQEKFLSNFDISTADVEPRMIWNRDDTCVYLRAFKDQDTDENSTIVVDISLRVS